MRFLKKNTKGFTLIEILIVVIILAVIAGLAIPIYQGQVERSRGAEALENLQAMRASMLRYFSQNNDYTAATLSNIDYNPNTVGGGQNRFFSYGLSGLGASTFVITATRIAGTVNGVAVPASGPHTITIDQAGTVTRSSIYQ